MFIIQKNVPLPKVSQSSQPSRRKYPFEDMDVGDMLFVPHKKRNTLATHVSTVGKDLGRKFSTRMVYMKGGPDEWYPAEKDDAGAVLGIGIWRIE